MSEYVTPRHRVYFDQETCGNAIKCLKCVNACLETGANCIGFVNESIPLVGENAPKRLEEIKHVLFGTWMYKCDACGKCVEVCPKNAVKLVKAETPVPRAVVYKPSFEIRCTTLKDGSMPAEAQSVLQAIMDAAKLSEENKE